jgi:hypothetical protein
VIAGIANIGLFLAVLTLYIYDLVRFRRAVNVVRVDRGEPRLPAGRVGTDTPLRVFRAYKEVVLEVHPDARVERIRRQVLLRMAVLTIVVLLGPWLIGSVIR